MNEIDTIVDQLFEEGEEVDKTVVEGHVYPEERFRQFVIDMRKANILVYHFATTRHYCGPCVWCHYDGEMTAVKNATKIPFYCKPIEDSVTIVYPK